MVYIKLTSQLLSGGPKLKGHCIAVSSNAAQLVLTDGMLMSGACSQVAVCMQGQKVLLEKTGSQLGEQELPDFQLQTPRRDLRESSLEESSQEESHDQLSPQHWEKSQLFQEPAPKLTGTGKHTAFSPSLLSPLCSLKYLMVLQRLRPVVYVCVYTCMSAFLMFFCNNTCLFP